jgi:sigma-B regulation protein RsbU (phosphoserine phosphatase)
MKDINKTKKQLIAELEHLRSKCEILENQPTASSAQKLLQESELRYKRLVDHLTDYVYTVQVRKGKVAGTVHGPGCAAVTGYSPEDYQANPGLWIDMVVKLDRSAVTRLSKRALKGQTVRPLEHRIITRQGRLRWVRNTIVFRQSFPSTR